MSGAVNLLVDILNNVLSNLHVIQKNLDFWESRAEVNLLLKKNTSESIVTRSPILSFQGTSNRKVYFMVFERGPKVFVKETVHLIGRSRVNGPSMQYLYCSADSTISEKISVLTALQGALASFLSEVCFLFDMSFSRVLFF